MTFNNKYNISNDTDFEDIELDSDNKLFVDPYLIYISKSNLASSCSNRIVEYFKDLLECAKTGNNVKGLELVKHLQENNEVRLGYSSGKPCGKGFGYGKGIELYETLRGSKAVKSGLVSDIFDSSIMIDGIGPDKISDLTINIILENLIEYTQKQCLYYNVPLEKVKLKRPVWCSNRHSWITLDDTFLPVHEGKPVILVPSSFVRPHLVYTYVRFYNRGMLPEYEKYVRKDPSSKLVKVLKGSVAPSRTKIRHEYPCHRSNVIDFIKNNPQVYARYKYNQLHYVQEKDIQ